MHPPIQSTTLTADEAAMLEIIRRGELRKWIYDHAKLLGDGPTFMHAVCELLSVMQGKGLIRGFESSMVGGHLMPVVSRVALVVPQQS